MSRTRRVAFTAVVEASVTVQAGESVEDALRRAEGLLQGTLDRHARSFAPIAAARSGVGPTIGVDFGSVEDDA